LRKENNHVQEQFTITKTVALFHPGEMGSALGAVLASCGFPCYGPYKVEAHRRTLAPKLRALKTPAQSSKAVKAAEVVISVCPPHAALALAREAAANGLGGIYVDANAISPATARAIGTVIKAAGGTFVDGGIIGLPPTAQKQPTLYLSWAQAATIAALFRNQHTGRGILFGYDAFVRWRSPVGFTN
jgi:3-hydroxyisobutyrate dehydrogenase-like beta-hydroxyacid dehydrogenase